jgi:hypothetical protein
MDCLIGGMPDYSHFCAGLGCQKICQVWFVKERTIFLDHGVGDDPRGPLAHTT